MEIEISKTQLNDVKALMADIKNGEKKVFVTSINKTLTTGRTQATARIGNELNLKASRIKEDFTIQKANYQKIQGALVATGAPVGLINFGASETTKGVSVKVKRSSPRKLLKHAFIAKGGGKTNQKEHLFWRARQRNTLPPPKIFQAGKKSSAPWPKFGDKYRLQIHRMTGPRIEDIFANPRVFDPVLIQMNFLYLKNMEIKIDEILRRHNG